MTSVTELVEGYGPDVPVRVSLNGQSWSTEALSFLYHAPLVLGTIDPAYGPSGGGSRVNITLGAADARDAVPFVFDTGSTEVVCRFGAVVVPAAEVYPQSVVCISPATVTTGGEVVVEVSVNGGADFTAAGLLFTYTPETVGFSISPRFGPTEGGTVVTVRGQGLPRLPTGLARCAFGADVVPAVRSGEGFVSCQAPRVPAPQTVQVEVSLNGQDFSQYGLRYNYEPRLSVAALQPNQGPVEGGTPVAVTGGPFRNESSDLLKCRFGDQESPARYMSGSLVGCKSPPLRSVDEIQSLSVYSLAHVPEVQTVTIDADDYVEEQFTIRTWSNATMRPEIQVIQTDVDVVDEIQTVSAGKKDID
jgi:hypothetical protein